MTFWCWDRALAVPGNCGANCQVFGGSATLDPGNYYLNIPGVRREHRWLRPRNSRATIAIFR